MTIVLPSSFRFLSTALLIVTSRASRLSNAFVITSSPVAQVRTYQYKNRMKHTTMSVKVLKNKSSPSVMHVPDGHDLIPAWFNKERTRVITAPDVVVPKPGNCVYYWMQRDMRTQDNWALLFANFLAKKQNVPLKVLFVLPCPVPSDSAKDNDFPPKVCEMNMTARHGSFLLGGLKIVESELRDVNVSFEVLKPKSHDEVGMLVHDHAKNNAASAVVCDMSPLRRYREWTEVQASPLFIKSKLPLYQVDAHNVVPVWIASSKREVGARTLRPKISKLLPDFLTHYPTFEGNDNADDSLIGKPVDWVDCEKYLNFDRSVKQVPWAKPGYIHAITRFNEFTSSPTEGLKNFDTLRNDPNYEKVCSNLSPYINYGHVSFQRLALEVRALKKHPNGTASFIEEGIVRRELSDNYIFYTDCYDELNAAADWARETLDAHSNDKREYIYSLQQLEECATHDDLWNAAQAQLMVDGMMHGFLRMYWAKKILEWTESPAQALRIALYLNDRYALDGNDPNGFTGVGWSIFGLHDMGWKERPVFGKIRYMNYAGCKRKFKVDQFVSRYKKKIESVAGVKRGLISETMVSKKARK